MVADVSVRGAEKFAILARALRDIGDRELKRELYSGLNRATIPLRMRARLSAVAVLPRRGGLGERVARSRFATRRRAGFASAGVTITARGMPQLRRMDRGMLRHPVYGNRRVWVTQRVTPGWFTRPMQAGVPEVRRELERVLDDVAEKVVRRVR